MRNVACLALVTIFAACIPNMPKGTMRAENKSVPESYDGSTDRTNSADTKWRDFFNDPKLAALVDTALANNQELNIISHEILVAKNEVTARQGDFLPQLDFEVGAGIEKVGDYTSQGKADAYTHTPKNLPDFAFGFNFSWEIDIVGKLRNAKKAALMRFLSSGAGRHFAVTTLVREIADTYYELLALDAELVVVKQNLAIQQNGLQVVRLQKEAAQVTELAVKRFEAEVLKNQSRQYTIAQQIVEAETELNVLVGRFPQHVDRSAQPFIELVPAVVKAGVPSQLLEKRPDVQQAELELAAAKLDVKVAKAAFYPSLNLSASVGYDSYSFLKIVNTPASLAYSLAAGLLVPILNRQKLNAGYLSANSRQMQSVYKFERAVLNAYAEVVKQLAMISNLGQSYGLEAQQVDKLTQSIDISNQLFASARANYMEVLLTRREALEAQVELIENKKRQLTAAVGLYQALGGGWR